MASKKIPSSKTASSPEQQFQIIGYAEQYPPQVYCDGIVGMTLTPAVCKLDLFQVVGRGEQGEKRKLTQTLVIPTAALLQLSRAVIANMDANASAFKTALADQAKIFGEEDAK